MKEYEVTFNELKVRVPANSQEEAAKIAENMLASERGNGLRTLFSSRPRAQGVSTAVNLPVGMGSEAE